MRFGSKSIATVYDLISEGPITLVNGLNSIYLNRTPIANNGELQGLDSTYNRLPGSLDASGTEIQYQTLMYIREDGSSTPTYKWPALQTQNSTGNPVLIHAGAGQDTITTISQVSGSDKSTITTTGNFFRESVTLIGNLTTGTGTPYTNGSYDVTSSSYSYSGSGTGATFNILVADNVVTIENITVTASGSGYFHGETFTILGSVLGGVDSTDDVTFDVSSRFITPEGEGILKQKIRIPGYGVDGDIYEGTVTALNSSTQAVVKPALSSTDTSTPPTIAYDYYVNATSISRYAVGRFLEYKIILPEAIPNTNIRGERVYFGVKTSTEGQALPSAGASTLNFPSAKASFLPGLLDQPVQSGVPTIASATNSTKIGTTIKQLDSYLANVRTANMPGKYKWELPSGQTGDSTPTTISATTAGAASPGETDEIQLTFNFPSGLYTQGETKNGNSAAAVFQVYFEYRLGDGEFKSALVHGPSDSEVSLASFLAGLNTGTFYQGGRGTGEFRSRSEVSTDFSIQFPIEQFKPFTDWKVVIKKVTADRLSYRDGTLNMITDSNIKTITTIINDKLSYPFSAYAAVSFNSNDLQGEFPDRAYHCKGVEVSVPTNYITRDESSDGVAVYHRDIITGEDKGIYQRWDGNMRRTYTDNPIWNLREVLLNKRWGLGHWLEESNINDYSLYSLARYCDELVPDGKGGLEPRFTCGVYLTKPTEAYKVIKDFCSTMFALPYWVDGQFIVEGDRPGEPVYNFTKGNIIDGIFSYEGTGNKRRPNQIVVRFNDKDNFYEEDIELVDDVEDMISRNRIHVEEVIAFGATSRSQARRFGKWKLLTSKMQKEMVSFRTGENAGFLKPGSIITIHDADRTLVSNSGRLASGSTTSVLNLDRSVNLSTDSAVTNSVLVQTAGSASYLIQPEATIASIATVNSISAITSGTDGTYAIAKDTYTTSLAGFNATFSIVISGSGTSAAVIVTDGGFSFQVGETLTIPKELIGNTNADLTFNVATVSTTDYVLGDLLPDVDTVAKAQNIVDSEGEEVTVQFSPDTHLVKKDISTTGITSTLTLTSALDTAPSQDAIWAIVSTRDNAIIEGSAKEYRILGIAEESPGVYGITAAEHFNAKFDILDERLISENPIQVPRYADVPPPTNLTVGLRKDYESDSDSSNKVCLVLNWDAPQEIDERLYENLSVYRIWHTPPNQDEEPIIIDVSPNTNYYVIKDISEGKHTFRVQGISGFGPVSSPAVTSISIGELGTSVYQYISDLPAAGEMYPVLRVDGSSIVLPTDSSGHADYEITAASGQKIYVSATEPTDPVAGSIWYDSANDVQNLGNSQTSQWVEEVVDDDVIVVEDRTIEQSTTTNSSTTVTVLNEIRFNTDGTVDIIKSLDGTPTTTADVYDWIIPADNAGDYEIKAEQISAPTNGASFTGITLGTWNALTSNRTVGMTTGATTSMNATGTVRISIRDTATSTVRNVGDVIFNNTVTEITASITLTGATVTDFSNDTSTTYSNELQLTSTGLTRWIKMVGTPTSLTNWISPTSEASGAYYARFTFTGSSALISGAATSSWQSLSGTQKIVLTTNGQIFYNEDWRAMISDEASDTTAGSFTIGEEYRIESVGTTSFTSIGASSNTVGVIFTATGAGSGTGTARKLVGNELFEVIVNRYSSGGGSGGIDP